MAVRLLTLSETAERMRIPETTLRYWRPRGEGPTPIKVGRRLLYPESEVDAYLQAQIDAAKACGTRVARGVVVA